MEQIILSKFLVLLKRVSAVFPRCYAVWIVAIRTVQRHQRHLMSTVVDLT